MQHRASTAVWSRSESEKSQIYMDEDPLGSAMTAQLSVIIWYSVTSPRGWRIYIPQTSAAGGSFEFHSHKTTALK